MLPYKGKAGETTLKSLRSTLKNLPYQQITRAKLSTLERNELRYLTSKMKLAKNNNHLIYKAQCPDLNCDETYVREVGRRFSEPIIDQSGRDDKSHLYEHAKKTGHENVSIDHLKFCRVTIKTANSRENWRRHYLLSI